MYYIIENVQRNGVHGYRLVKTYKNWKAMDKWLRREGRPLWVVYWNTEPQWHLFTHYGNFRTTYYNTGGYGDAIMPLLPFHQRFGS